MFTICYDSRCESVLCGFIRIDHFANLLIVILPQCCPSAGWRLSEFHDGHAINGMNGTIYAGDQWRQNAASQGYGGWNFYSYGDVRDNTRFWIHITDQPSICWTK